jgi:peptidoglycan hydrolase CwlO-like protein
MNSAEQIANMFNTYGAWGVVSVCIIGIMALWTIKERIVNKKDEEIKQVREDKEKALEALNERIVKMTEKQTEMLTENRIVNQNIEKLLNKFIDSWTKFKI